MIRHLAVLSLAGAFALSAGPAMAQDFGGPPPPPCAPGQTPTFESPCQPPPCAEGQRPTFESPCLPPPCAAGQRPTFESPCLPPPCAAGAVPTPEAPCVPVPGPGGPGGPGFGPGGPGVPCGPGPGGPGGFRIGPAPVGPPPGPGCGPGGPPELMPGFLGRVWRFAADADSYDAASNTLNVTVTKVNNLPKRFASQADEIVDQDGYVRFSGATRVYDRAGRRIPREARYDTLLDAANTVLVVGKMIPPAKWQEDADGTPVPTIRAKRVTITG